MAKAEDLSDAYANFPYIPDAASYPPKWEEDALAFREVEHAIGRARLNQPYGPGSREQLDLFLPRGKPAGLIVFIHGGYWKAFDCKSWSHFAKGATDAGWAVALPSYTLAPEARIAEITQQMVQAVNHAAELVPGEIRITGHSAGGHLSARFNDANLTLSDGVAERITRLIPISPLADLRPLMQTDMNDDLRIDLDEAETESPLLLRQRRGIGTHIWVGAEERPAFLDQARWLHEAWPEAQLSLAPGCHHFDVIDGLTTPDSPIMRSILV